MLAHTSISVLLFAYCNYSRPTAVMLYYFLAYPFCATGEGRMSVTTAAAAAAAAEPVDVSIDGEAD